MFRQNPAHTGVANGPETVGYGGLRWRFLADGEVRSTPAVSGGHVYFGSGGGSFYALELATGNKIWEYQSGSAVTSSPAIAGDLVIFGSWDGSFTALQRATGHLAWRVQTGTVAPWAWGFESGDFWTSSPVVSGDTVWFGTGSGQIWSVAASTGRVLWTATTAGRVRSSPALWQGTIYVGSADGYVYALDAATGAQRWRTATRGAELFSGDFGFDRRTIQSSPAVADGRVFVGARDGWLYALDARTGERLWDFDHQVSWVNTPPAVHEGVVYAGSSDGRFIQAVSAADGQEVWRHAPNTLFWSAPTIVGSQVLTGDQQGNLRALDRQSGELLWSAQLGIRLTSPVIVDGLVLTGSADGALYAVDVTRSLERVVYFDTAWAQAAGYEGDRALRDRLEARGYRVVDDAGLTSFLDARAADRAPSVIVFASDYLTHDSRRSSQTGSFSRYLRSGGKVVWIGVPPAMWDPSPDGEWGLGGINRARTSELLGVDLTPSNFDLVGTATTPAASRWGVPPGQVLASWGAVPGSVDEVLQIDQEGNAVGFVKRFGGRPGTGFIRVWGSRVAMPDPSWIQWVAEIFPTD